MPALLAAWPRVLSATRFPSPVANSIHFGSDVWVPSLVTILITTLFIYFAARIVLDRSSFLAALATAVISTLLAVLVSQLAGGGTLGLILGILVWALVTGAFFRTSMLKAVVIGLVAWALSLLVGLILSAF